MITNQVNQASEFYFLLSKAKAFVEMLKVRLSFLVAFSCAFGYMLAVKGSINIQTLIMLTFGGFLMSGASVCINQIIETDLDKIMTRTAGRPLPTGRLSKTEVTIFTILCMLASTWILWIY